MVPNKPESTDLSPDMLTEPESMAHEMHAHSRDRGWSPPPEILPLLQICAYALRAKRMLGRSGLQSRAARRHRSRFYEDVWRDAAGDLGATAKVLSKGTLEISRGGLRICVHLNQTPLDGRDNMRLSRAKPVVGKILRSRGLPTPDEAEFSLKELEQAYRFLAQHRLCVVKPAYDTSSGSGITTHIETPRQLFRAAMRAAGYCRKLLIQEQVEGDTIRLLYLDGQLLHAVKRNQPTVLGDGKSRVSQLVKKLNKRRIDAGYKLAETILKYDLDMELTLARQDLSWRSVPAKNRQVVLKTVVNENMADENESVVNQISDTIIAAGRLASELVGVRLAGVDIITSDLHRGLKETGGKILEVNTTPGYHYHYLTQNGNCRVAVPILKTCFEHALISEHVA